MTLFVSISRAVIQHNQKHKKNEPPFEVRQFKADKNPQRVHRVNYTGTITTVYDPENPLPSGAVAWVEINTPTPQQAVTLEKTARPKK